MIADCNIPYFSLTPTWPQVDRRAAVIPLAVASVVVHPCLGLNPTITQERLHH